ILRYPQHLNRRPCPNNPMVVPSPPPPARHLKPFPQGPPLRRALPLLRRLCPPPSRISSRRNSARCSSKQRRSGSRKSKGRYLFLHATTKNYLISLTSTSADISIVTTCCVFRPSRSAWSC